MSKSFKDVEAAEKVARKAVDAAKKALDAAKKKMAKVMSTWSFRCKRCNLAFKTDELGYRDYEVRKTEQDCQPMGEYDMWQVVEHQHIACCPKCGHSFNVEVSHPDFIGSTPKYSRWEDKPEIKECYKKCLSDEIKKVDSRMVQYIEKHRYD